LGTADRLLRMREEGAAAAARLDPVAGRMLEAVWVNWSGEGRLLVGVYHLAVDGVSLRILVPDPRSGGGAALRGEPPILASEGTPFRVWARHLYTSAHSDSRQAECAFWERTLAAGTMLMPKADLDPQLDTHASAGSIDAMLSGELSEAVLTSVPN